MSVSSQKIKTRARTAARMAAVQALFQHFQSEESLEQIEKQFLLFRLKLEGFEVDNYEDGEISQADVTLFASLIKATLEHLNKSIEQVSGTLPADWPIARIDPVLKALLCMAYVELAAFSETPYRVIINEYIDIAYGFFSGDEPKMVNGILNTLARALRPDEFSS